MSKKNPGIDKLNENYFAEFTKQFSRVPRDIAMQVAGEVFEAAVQRTRVDSGQAAANWKYQPYKGAPFTESQEIMWGYANVDPINPVGYKWAMYDNSEAVYRWQFEQLIDRMAATPLDIDGIMVYNPITTGFAGFAPGDDAFYPDNAFKNLDMEAIVSAAMSRAYAEYNSGAGNNYA